MGNSPTDVPEVLTAPAASPAAANILDRVAEGLQEQVSAQFAAMSQQTAQQAQQAAALGITPPVGQQPQPTQAPKVGVTEIVPLLDTNPSGAGLTTASFPMVLGGSMSAIILTFLIKGPLQRLATLLTVGVFPV